MCVQEKLRKFKGVVYIDDDKYLTNIAKYSYMYVYFCALSLRLK